MNRLSEKSTFKDFKELLKQKDDLLIRQIKYLGSNQFKSETNGYLKRNFQFFTAIALREISASSQEGKIFLESWGNINATTWRAQASLFVSNGKDSSKLPNNTCLNKIDENTPMSCFLDGTWYDLKDQKENFIFHPNNVSIFDYKDDNGNIISGDVSAKKEKMRQIAEFLINGKQITLTGGLL